MPVGECSVCKKPVTVSSKSLPPGRRKCQPCRRADGGKPCVDCGKPKGKHGSRCYSCDRADRGRKAGIKWETGVVCLVHFRDCSQCGRPFTARHDRTKLCSRECQLTAKTVRMVDLYATARTLGPHVNTGTWRAALVDHLRERDGDDCGICGRTIDFALPSGTRGSDEGKSIDHIHPHSLGGSGELDNLRLAHWGCNRRRGNRDVDGMDFSALYEQVATEIPAPYLDSRPLEFLPFKTKGREIFLPFTEAEIPSFLSEFPAFYYSDSTSSTKSWMAFRITEARDTPCLCAAAMPRNQSWSSMSNDRLPARPVPLGRLGSGRRTTVVVVSVVTGGPRWWVWCGGGW